MMYDLLRGIFSNEYMATHSLAGGNKDKEPLPAGIVDMIIGQSVVRDNLQCLYLFLASVLRIFSFYHRRGSGILLSSIYVCWRCSIVGRTLVSVGELSRSCTRLLTGWVTALWLSHPLSVSQHGQLSLPSLWVG